MTEETTQEGPRDNPYTNEQIVGVIKRLRVCQVAGLRLIGVVPKNREDDDTKVLEDVMGVSIKITPMGALPVIVSVDFCALPLPIYRVEALSGEYWVRELNESDARTYAQVYLGSIADLIRQRTTPDPPEGQIMQANQQTINMLNQRANSQMPPGVGGPGGIIPGR